MGVRFVVVAASGASSGAWLRYGGDSLRHEVESTGGTRGVAITLPHFFKHWQNEDLRRLVLNGIAWAARAEVPASGIQTALPDLEQFDPESVVP